MSIYVLGDNGHVYSFVNNALSYSDAKLAASNSSYNGMKGHLLTITSSVEQTFILSNTSSLGLTQAGFIWLGLENRNGVIGSWTTGETFSYAKWASTPFTGTGFEARVDAAMVGTNIGTGRTTGDWIAWGDSTQTASYIIEYENNPPIITSTANAATLENTPIATVIYTATASDPDANTTLSYSISGGADAALFNIDASTGGVSFKTSPNFEAPVDADTNNIYDITVRASDGLLYTDKGVAISVANRNESPFFASFQTSLLLSGATYRNDVWSVTFSGDTNKTISYQVTPDDEVGSNIINVGNALANLIRGDAVLASKYSVNVDDSQSGTVGMNFQQLTPGSTLISAAISDATPSTTPLAVGVTNGDGVLTHTSLLMSGATYRDDVWSISFSGDVNKTISYQVNPNDEIGSNITNVGNALANLIRGDAVLGSKYSVVVDTSHSGTAGINFQQLTAGNIAIAASAGDATPGTSLLSVSVNSVFRASTSILGSVSTTTAVYTATATDPDLGSTLSYSISGGADAGLFNINAATGAVTFKASPNFEAPADTGANNVYDVTVRASDGALYADKAVAITVTDVNEVPQQTVSNFGTHFYEVVNQQVTWTEALNAAASRSYNGMTGHLVTITSEAENSFLTTLVQQKVTTGWNYNAVWIAASDVATEGQWKWMAGPEAGTLFWNGNLTGSAVNGIYNNWYNLADENSGSGLVGSFSNPTGSGSDFAMLDTSYWSPGVWDDVFSSTSATSNASSPVASSDGVRNAYIIEYENLPPLVTSGATASTAENVSTTTAVYTATATDPDANTTLTYSIGGGDYSILGGADGELFNINASTGAVTFKRSPNFEAPTDSGSNNVYDIIVQASDGSLTATKAVAITVTDVPEATTSSLHGMTYFWKADATGKHALLSGVTVNASGGAGPSEGANAPIQVKNIAWDAAGHVIADVYVHITAGMDSFDLNLDFGTGTNAAFTSAMDSSWTLLNNSSASSLLISAYSLTAASSGDVKLGSLAFDVGSASQAHIGVNGGSEISFNNVATKATAFAYDMAHSTTGSDGSFSFSSVASGGYALAATRGIADIGNAITSADALSALKIAVSMNPNAVLNGQQLPVSPFQFMAADANGDGRVTSADALAILKMAVKLPSATTPQWMFVEDTRDFYDDANGVFTLTRSNASWDRTITANVLGDTTENLVGIIKGDVNGSWATPAGSSYVETLQPNYFTTLANTIHAPISEFGVFG